MPAGPDLSAEAYLTPCEAGETLGGGPMEGDDPAAEVAPGDVLPAGALDRRGQIGRAHV